MVRFVLNCSSGDVATAPRDNIEYATNSFALRCTFPEWHEDSQIEPVVGDTSSIPELLTNGIEYEPYGDLYLDILREATTDYS